jgi:hypothetical protein
MAAHHVPRDSIAVMRQDRLVFVELGFDDPMGKLLAPTFHKSSVTPPLHDWLRSAVA